MAMGLLYSGERLSRIAAGREVGDLGFINAGIEPCLRDEQHVNLVVADECRNLRAFLNRADRLGIKQCNVKTGV